jgi:tetratricopeptide (TPR) repeat protein
MIRLSFLCALLLLMQACAPVEAPDLLTEIRELEQQLKSAQDIQERKEEARALIDKTLAYFEANPKDTVAARQLFLAGDVARGIRDHGKAMQCLEAVWRNFPEFRLAPDALFLQGFALEVDRNDTENAALYYREFLRSYPEHHLALQVEQLLSVLDQSPEELIRQFQQREQED